MIEEKNCDRWISKGIFFKEVGAISLPTKHSVCYANGENVYKLAHNTIIVAS